MDLFFGNKRYGLVKKADFFRTIIYFITYQFKFLSILKYVFLFFIMVISLIGCLIHGLDVSKNFYLLILTYVIISTFTFLWFFYSKNKKTPGLQNKTFINPVNDTQKEEEAQSFFNDIISRSKKYLIQKYGKIDLSLPEESQIQQFNWLKNKRIISQEKYEQLLQEYKLKKSIAS